MVQLQHGPLMGALVSRAIYFQSGRIPFPPAFLEGE